MKLGRKPPIDFGDKAVRLSAVLKVATLPSAPAHFGHGSMFSDWGMLGNDQYGDCTCAGSDHEHMLWTGIGNHGANSAKFTTDNTLSDYSAITGFDPNDPSTDQGAMISDVMDYRRTTGMIDENGRRHKIDLGARLSGGKGSFSWDEFINAVWCFKAVAVGTLVPQSAMEQFNAGEPWDYVPGSPIEGGHYIPAVGSTDKTSLVTVLTWGRRQFMTKAFFEHYVDELWVPLSEEAMSAIETATHLVDWAAVKNLASTL